MYRKYGYYAEKTENLYFEGAEGSETITVAKSYREEPLTSVSGLSVLGVKDFLQEELFDEEKDTLPRKLPDNPIRKGVLNCHSPEWHRAQN